MLLEGLFVVSLELEELDDGLAGVAVEPEADEDDGDDGLAGWVLLEGAALEPRDALLLAPRSQPASAVPRARDTAMARADNLMGPP